MDKYIKDEDKNLVDLTRIEPLSRIENKIEN
jgi:hypothetical protein